jgi:hypothetical protein
LIINRSFLLSLAVSFALIISACKDDTVTQNTNNNNNQNPTSPELTEPANNSIVTVSSPVLKWNTFPNTVSYRIQISYDANFIGTMFVDTSTNSTELQVRDGLLTTGVNFYWRVMAMQNGNNSNWSAVWRFSIILAPPPPPILISPANGSSNQSFTPLFDWDDSFTAQTYRLQISANSSFTNILYNSPAIGVSQFQCPPMILNTNTQYYWRVNASNSNGLSTGEWSVPFNFTTVNGPEPNSISGIVTFADNNFVHLPFHYTGCAFSSTNWPPAFFLPAGFDSLDIQQSGNVYTAAYKIRSLPNGTYYIATAIKDRSSFTEEIYGTYGCDTSRTKFSNCAFTPIQVTITDNNGVTGINFLSWADSTKTIFP